MEQEQKPPQEAPIIQTESTPTVTPPVEIEDVPNKKSHKKIIITILALLLVASLMSLVAFFWWKSTSKETSNDIPTQKELTVSLRSGVMPRFAEFMEETITTEPKIPDYTINTSEIINLRDVQNTKGDPFNSDQLAALSDPGFFIEQAPTTLTDGDEVIDISRDSSDEFLMLYRDIQGDYAPEKRKPENAVFISSDLLLHTYHVYIDRTFQHIEQTQLQPKLYEMTDILYENAYLNYQQTTNPELKNSLARLSAFFLIPKVILETSQQPAKSQSQSSLEAMGIEGKDEGKDDSSVDSNENILAKFESYQNQIPAEIYQKTKQELQLVIEAEGAQPSPIFGEYKIVNGNLQFEDYTQFKPRSHYTKNSILRSYWKAMMWYGRGSFLTKSKELTLDAMVQSILLSSTSKNGQNALDLWEDIYLPTVFFVGQSDDLTIYDYMGLIKNIYGDSFKLESLTEETKFTSFMQELKKLEGPAIQSSIILIVPDDPSKDELLDETKSFRLMGQRFIPDSYIFSELTQGDEAPDPETGEKLPPIPTALMAMSIFGNQRATLHLENWIVQNASNSKKVLSKEIAKLNTEFKQFNKESWTQNLYWSWLYTLNSLSGNYGKGYPQFMQNTKWEDKSLYTILGSWTELRHDTLLYAKQSYAEMGGGMEPPEPPPVPKGYVEPNLVFLNRIIALSKMTKDGLESSGVLDEPAKARIERLTESFEFYRDFAVKELNNEIISDNEFEKLRTSTSLMDSSIMPYDSGSLISAKEVRAGIIADVHTAVTQNGKEILYEATGVPNMIYVAITDANGTRLTRGVTYSYYEFIRPFGERLSDEDWQTNIYEGNTSFPTPPHPDWIKDIQK